MVMTFSYNIIEMNIETNKMTDIEKKDEKSNFRERELAKLIESLKDNETIHYLHSGDMGDILAGLESVKELFNLTGKRGVLHLDFSNGLETGPNRNVREILVNATVGKGLKFNRRSYEFLRPLLIAQPYIEDVVPYSESDESLINVNLNVFRRFSALRDVNEKLFSNLMYCQQLTCFLAPGYRGPWLTLPPGVSESVELPLNSNGKARSFAVSRSSRYQSCQIFLSSIVPILESEGFFIGTELEYESLIDCTRIDRDKFQRVEVGSALDIAAIQSRCTNVLANATLSYWTAVGIGAKVIHELPASEMLFSTYMPECRNTLFLHSDNTVSFDFEKMSRHEKSMLDIINGNLRGGDGKEKEKEKEKEEEGNGK